MKLLTQLFFLLTILTSFQACGSVEESVEPVVVESAEQLTGGLPLLVVRMQFSDYKFTNSVNVWSQKIFGTDVGELNDYFKAISYNTFYVSQAEDNDSSINGLAGDGFITVTLPYAHPGNDTLSADIFSDALTLTNAYIDFSQYDTNGDGHIQSSELQVMFLVAGGEWATGLNDGGVWAHQSSLSNLKSPTLDGVTLMRNSVGGSYSCFGEHHFDHSHDATFGIIAHELGHSIFNLPDLYDIDYSSQGIGDFGIMGSGNWTNTAGQRQGATPVHMSAWSKIQVGFATATEINTTQSDINLTGASDSNYTIIKVPITSSEYFLLENRDAKGYDLGFYSLDNAPYSGGLAIWHIDETQSDNSDDLNRLVDLEEANDPELHLSISGKTGARTNLYYAGNATEFSTSTTPDTNDSSGAATNISILNISAVGSVMSLDISQ
jgi:M6 family metalloprotease-like protein